MQTAMGCQFSTVYAINQHHCTILPCLRIVAPYLSDQIAHPIQKVDIMPTLLLKLKETVLDQFYFGDNDSMTIGRSPDIARPTAVPMMPDSARGVSTTR